MRARQLLFSAAAQATSAFLGHQAVSHAFALSSLSTLLDSEKIESAPHHNIVHIFTFLSKIVDLFAVLKKCSIQ